MRIALDTNILVYAEGVNGIDKREAAFGVVGRLPPDNVVVPIQALGELFNVLVRKAGRSRTDARAAMMTWGDAYQTVGTTPEVLSMAADLAASHNLGIWDSIVLSAAANADCRLLLSEDLQAGFTWGGVTVVNPFASPADALLDRAFLSIQRPRPSAPR